MKIAKRVLLIVVAIAAASALGAVIYLMIGVHGANETAVTALQSDSAVTVNRVGDETSFIGPDVDEQNTYGFIFYQGAKIEADAYAPLLHQLAAKGWICVTMDMPHNFALLDATYATDAIAQFPQVEHWYIGGHSFGGLIASAYAAHNADKIEGLVLLGAYSMSDLSSSDLAVLTVRGTNDTVLHEDEYEASQSRMPADFREVVIEGGNHSQFGDYGLQEGDSPADISAEEQIRETVEVIDSLKQTAVA